MFPFRLSRPVCPPVGVATRGLYNCASRSSLLGDLRRSAAQLCWAPRHHSPTNRRGGAPNERSTGERDASAASVPRTLRSFVWLLPAAGPSRPSRSAPRRCCPRAPAARRTQCQRHSPHAAFEAAAHHSQRAAGHRPHRRAVAAARATGRCARARAAGLPRAAAWCPPALPPQQRGMSLPSHQARRGSRGWGRPRAASRGPARARPPPIAAATR
mmetsp:Transcript_21378/g.52510  ORF Transcript_21378/g.52510 Transcript_21378/m.52510 type:complete len:214 (-) Transcript_21378:605-1246(-)